VGVKDQSAFYNAGAEAMKLLAARCEDGRLGQIFEDQAERYLRMAETSAQHAATAAPPASHIIPARRPPSLFRLAHLPRSAPTQRPANVVDMFASHAARGRREG